MLQSGCFSCHAGRCCRVVVSPAMLVDAAGVGSSPAMLVKMMGALSVLNLVRLILQQL